MGQIWKLNVTSNGSLNGSGEVLYQIASDAYHTHRARIFNDWDVFSAVDSRDLIRLRKGYTIEITEKLYSNEVVKVKLLDGRNKGELYYAIADDLSKKYLLEYQEKFNNGLVYKKLSFTAVEDRLNKYYFKDNERLS